jgi:hypothetical protein
VLQQLADRDVLEARIRLLRPDAEQLERLRVEVESSVLHQPEHRHGGDRLGDARDAEQRVRSDRRFRVDVGQTVTSGVY